MKGLAPSSLALDLLGNRLRPWIKDQERETIKDKYDILFGTKVLPL